MLEQAISRIHDNQGFERSQTDFCLYFKEDVWLILWVDDSLIVGKEASTIIQALELEFNAKNLGEPRTLLGLELNRRSHRLFISQEKIVDGLLKKFRMEQCKGARSPMEERFQPTYAEDTDLNLPFRELVGSLMYISICSRPDIAFATSFLSRHLHKPTQSLWKAGKRILQYLKTTAHYSLVYTRSNSKQELEAYSDSDWAGDQQDRKSTSGTAIFIYGNLIAWSSRKQQTVALSTAEAEYLAAASTATDLVHFRQLACEVTRSDKVYPVLKIDNQSAICLIKNYENSKRSKHIDIRAHFIKDQVEKQIISVEYVPTDHNVSDILTKALGTIKFCIFRKDIGVLEND
uniref:Reverse transcriptase Ty1/copia-type domain-containing protein n=1 Tax=Lygus hesperus TaxID=30085 RepID=A0A0K8T576_LYGHE